MSDTMPDTGSLPRVVVPVVGDLQDPDALAELLRQQLPIVELLHASSPAQAREEALAIVDMHTAFVPAAILTAGEGSVDESIDELTDAPEFDETRIILVTTRPTHDDLARSFDSGRLLSVMTDPITTQVVVRQLARRLSRWARYRHGEAPWSETVRQQAEELITEGTVEFSKQLRTSSTELAGHLLTVIEKVLGPRPRLTLPAGIHLTRQGRPLHGVFLILSGSVALHQSTPDGGDVLLHHASSGPLIGINSLTTRSLAAFTSKTTTPVQAVRITTEQLDRVMAADPDTAALLAMVSLRALSDRLVRAEQLHVEKERLADQLEAEHERTARASEQELAAARHDLEEAAQFAMLGQMASGIAHELNNPIAAIIRAADHVADGAQSLLGKSCGLEGGAEVLAAAREGEWLAPRDVRRLTRALAETVGDRRTASALVDMGITDPAAAKRLARRPEALASLHTVHAIGTSLRDIGLAARRITGLVQSLRSYSRSGDYVVHDVSIPEGIEDTLRLAAPQLAGVNIQRHYDPDVPRISCYPSRLEQVWTNIVINAAEAMAGVTDSPEIHVTVTRRGDDHVRIKFEDNGPGIPDDLLERIFLPRFTTKQGTVHYGLGMGLGICRQIIDAHDGQIKASNTDRGACMSVTLPIAGPRTAHDYTEHRQTEE